MSIDCSLKSLTSPGSNELLQSHNSLTFKLLKTVADFSQALANLHDRFGHELQVLVETFRKRNGELRKERKIQSKKIFAHRDRIETILLKSNELLIKCYKDYCQAYAMALTNPARYMSEYIASHNVYVHQLQATNGMIHAYQTKTLPRLLEELEECQLDTSSNITSSLLNSSELVSEKAAGYQVIAGACKQANHRQDLAQFVKVAASTAAAAAATEQTQTCASNLDDHDASASCGSAPMSLVERSNAILRYHQFQSPSLQNIELNQQAPIEAKNMQIVPTFKNEIAPDMSQPPAQQQPQLEKDRENLEERIEKMEERIETLGKLLARSSESRLHNKVNELQEELCQKRFDLYVAQIHLSAVRSQLQLFEYNYRPYPMNGAEAVDLGAGPSLAGASGGGGGQSGARKSPSGMLSSGSSATLAGLAGTPGNGHQPTAYRNKWIKALKSLKESPTPSPTNHQSGQQKFGDAIVQDGIQLQGQQGQQQMQQGQQQQQGQGQQQDNQHFFQEYTFKKIASCDVCKEFLRGHMRQGVKCKLCKISCHNDCQSKAHATIKCQQPKMKLLRRQKSAGELEVNNVDGSDQPDQAQERPLSSKPDSIYQLIRQVLDAKKKGSHSQQQQLLQQQHMEHLRLASYGADNRVMNISTGNLALANGKSVSTSALGTASNASVDRWSVVMDLLAQSRKKEKGAYGAGPDDGSGPPGGVSSGKRHSKQLDKFKSAAWSAAAASKHQRHYNSQQSTSQQVLPAQSQGLRGVASAGQVSPPGSNKLLEPKQQQLGQINSSPLVPLYTPQQLHHVMSVQPPSDSGGSGGSGYPGQQGPVGVAGAGTSSGLHLGEPQQSMLLHHTKSLPVGQAQTGGFQQMVGRQHQAPQQQQQQQSLTSLGSNENVPPGGQQQLPYHLLNIGSQQMQSTSAPHSPQRKRFNLRMKSFSLDSPESPSVIGVPPTSYAGAPGQDLQDGGQHSLQQQHHSCSAHLYTNSGAVAEQLYDGQTSGGAAAGYQQPPSQFRQPPQFSLYSNADDTAQSSSGQQPSSVAAVNSNYLSSGRQAGGGNGTLTNSGSVAAPNTSPPGHAGYHQRHSYHNQAYHYQQQPKQLDNNPQPPHLQQQQQGGSHSALNSIQLTSTSSKLPAASRKQHRSSLSGASESANAGSILRPGVDGSAMNDYYDLGATDQRTSQQQSAGGIPTISTNKAIPLVQPQTSGAFVVLYDYLPQRADEIQLVAGQLVAVLEANERDWWKVRPLHATHPIGYFPSTYLAKLYHNERPLRVAQTIQVSNGETCDKLLRGQIVVHAGKQIDNFVTIRIVTSDSLDTNRYIQCPDKYLMEVAEVT